MGGDAQASGVIHSHGGHELPYGRGDVLFLTIGIKNI